MSEANGLSSLSKAVSNLSSQTKKMNFLLVFIGGGLGSICRYGIALALKPYALQFPYATLCANILSCVLIGFLMAKMELSSSYKLLLMTGFCGGFSTFSTFSAETFQLLQAGNIAYALANVIGSVIVCLGAIALGLKLGGQF